MANPTTGRVAMSLVYEPGSLVPLGANQVIVPGESVGRKSDGYHYPFDNSAAMDFAGISIESLVVTGGSADGDVSVTISRPRAYTAKIASSTNSLNKICYALYGDEVSLSGSNKNIAGTVIEVISATQVLVASPAYEARYLPSPYGVTP